MHRPLMIIGAVLLISACGPKPPEKAENTNASPDANPAATIPTPANESTAVDFVPKAAASDMFEIEAAKVADTRSTNPEVKDFAKMMGETHTKSSAALSAALAVSGVGIAPPAALPKDLQDKLDDLNKADAKDFDKKYIDGQEEAHQKALDLLTRYANDGDTPALKSFATAQISTVQAHLDSAKALKEKLK